MREIDQKAVLCKTDEVLFESFLKENQAFIINASYKATGRYITKSDDEWSIALSAFDEAIKHYTYEKGSFYSFAQLIIKRRLIDERKKQSRRNREITIDPYILESGSTQEEHDGISKQVIAKLSYHPDDAISLEIAALSGILKEYNFSFFDLVEVSPKAQKTKSACAKAIAFVIKSPQVLAELRLHKTLPLKIIEINTKLPRKILERHRKYLIAGIEIISGDYPYLSEYLKFVGEEL